MSELKCFSALDGIGDTCEKLTPFTLVKTLLLCTPGFTFTNAAALATIATVKGAIADKDIMLIPNITEQEDITVEDGEYTTPSGQIISTGVKGMPGFKFFVMLSYDQYKNLVEYSGRSFELITIDRANNILAVQNTDLTIQGFSMATFIVKTQTPSEVGKPRLVPIIVQLEDPTEYDTKGVYLVPSWKPSSLKPLTRVTITAQSTVAAFIFTLTVNKVSTSKYDNAGGVTSGPYTGAVAADFEVIDQGGAVETCSVVESTTTPGLYTFTGVDITSGSARVKPSATNMFESEAVTLVSAT